MFRTKLDKALLPGPRRGDVNETATYRQKTDEFSSFSKFQLFEFYKSNFVTLFLVGKLVTFMVVRESSP